MLLASKDFAERWFSGFPEQLAAPLLKPSRTTEVGPEHFFEDSATVSTHFELWYACVRSQ